MAFLNPTSNPPSLKEHEDELKKVADAAKGSVELLQELVDQKEKQIQSRDDIIEDLQSRRKEELGYHQQEINDMKTEIISLQGQVSCKGITYLIM
jgi:hypothetical protein